MTVIAEHGHLLLLMACAFGFFMAWGVGANDVANAMGTSVGSGALTIRQAIAIAIVFEFCGAYFAGGEVTNTIRSGIIAPDALSDRPDLLVYGMLSALLAAGTWLLIASLRGWPVSTTHSIIGALVGFAVVGVSAESVQWAKVGSIVASWVVSPVMAGILSFGLFMSVHRFILNTEQPFERAKQLLPLYMFAVGFMLSLMTLMKGLQHVGLEGDLRSNLLYAVLAGLLTSGVGIALLSRVRNDEGGDHPSRYASVERVFAVMMIFTACAMAFAHGSNDAANAIGPLAAVVGVVQSGGSFAVQSVLPSWVLLLGATGIVVGLATYGYKVIATIGKKITELTPSRGFAAELGAASTVVLASATGLPISTTHTLVGAILGVGLARGIAALNLRVIGGIFMSWVITLPAGAGLCILFFFLIKGIFSP